MNRSGKKCVLYPRVSTEMQVDGFSLDGQKNSLTRFADREEMKIVDVYEDAGKSGKSIVNISFPMKYLYLHFIFMAHFCQYPISLN